VASVQSVVKKFQISLVRNKRKIVTVSLLLAAVFAWRWLDLRDSNHPLARRESKAVETSTGSNGAKPAIKATGQTEAAPLSAISASPAGTPSTPGLIPATNTNLQVPGSATGQLSDSALRQIEALQQDKARRTPAQQKVDSQLLYAEKMRRGVPVANGVRTLRVTLDKDTDGRVQVDITARVTDELLQGIADAGGKVVNSFVQYEAIRAWLPLPEVELLAARPEVRFIRPAEKSRTNAGNVVSEGYFTHKVNVASNSFSATGSGVKVGVLSDSVDYLAQSQAAGELGAVTVLPGKAGSGEGEGTAMLEIVHDLAPGAQLFFATANGGTAAFAQSIRDLRFIYHCDVIVDDVDYFIESPFQDGVVAQAVNAVTADGALYFSSIGNSGNKNDNTSGTWEGDFVDGGALTVNSENGRVHRFGSANYNTIAPGGYSERVDLFWSDPLSASTNDYDVFLLSSNGSSVVALSDNSQNGTQSPYESIDKADVGERVVILRYSGTGRFLHLEVGRGQLGVSTSGRARGHSAAAEAFGVAAVDVSGSTNTFVAGSKNPVEDFSSDGPRRVFYYSDGSSITPGNFSSSGGAIRQKPDIAAADGGRTSVPGFSRFFGTSAAAPHAAAIAAVLKSYNPSLTPAQVRAALTGSALDIETTGVDRDSGYGIVMADAALRAVPAPSPPVVVSLSPAGGAVGTVVSISGSKFGGATLVKFNGVAATFTVNSPAQITATVPVGATTGVVTVTTPSGTSTNAVSFAVTLAPFISGFSPSSAAPGASVVISGANFNGTTAVAFNGIGGSFTVNSATQITATVPASGTTGRITVTTGNGTANSDSIFTVTALPTVAGFSPASGGVGTTVIVTGANFSGATDAKFNGVSAAGTINSATQITLTVPSGATTGPISVTTPAGTGTSSSSFVVVPAPAISGFTPSAGPAGTAVTISGLNFTNATNVSFNGTSAFYTVDSSSQITANVPAGATTGVISVRTPGGQASSGSSFTVVASPANDNFANAQNISGDSGAVSGSNIAATKQTGEPGHAGNIGGKSVWYRWSTTSNGAWSFDTSGSSFDTILAVYTGASLTNLTLVAGDDDAPGLFTSKVTFLAAASTNYWIAVDGYNAGTVLSSGVASGNVILNWSQTFQAPVISGFSPASGAAGATVTITGTNFANPLTVQFNGVTAAATLNSGTISATVPAGTTTGPITVTTSGGSASSLTNFIVLNRPANDNFAAAQLVSGISGGVIGFNLDATVESGEPNHVGQTGGRSVWYRWVAPSSGVWRFDTSGSSFDTLLGVYAGAGLGALSLVASNDDSGAVITSALAFSALSGQEYRIAVDGYGGAAGTVGLNWNSVGTGPVITDFKPASVGVGSSVTIRGANFINVTGVQVNGASAPGFIVDSTSQIRIIIPAGATNGPITVSTASGTAVSGGNLSIIDAPPNDNFAAALLLKGGVGVATGINNNAGKEAGEPNHALDPGGRSIWYYWVAPSNGVWTFDTHGSGFDTLLAAYSGVSVGALSLVASNDDSGEVFTSSMTFNAVSNSVYRIAVDGFGGASGDVILRYFPTPPSETIYSTFFAASEGYSTSSFLVGQNGWLKFGSGGNGILTNWFLGLGQQAYIGYTPPSVAGDSLEVYHPLDYTPDTNRLPQVTFSVLMDIEDSSNSQYDDFRWRFYNRAGTRLFSLDFDNATLGIFYALDDNGSFVSTGRKFTNGIVYSLVVSMDFGRNLWSATLDGLPLVANRPITTVGTVLTLGDIDAVWVPYATNNPGDNFMVFDNYSVTVGPSDFPAILSFSTSNTVPAGASTTLSVLAAGAPPFAYQWRLNGTNIPGATNAVFTLNQLSPSQAGNYSVLISNFNGSVTSSNANVTVIPTSPTLLSPLQSTNNLFQFQLSGTAGLVYTVQYSTNLSNWLFLFSVTNDSSQIQVADPGALLQPRRFYRVIVP
jgi:hypothetical protein